MLVVVMVVAVLVAAERTVAACNTVRALQLEPPERVQLELPMPINQTTVPVTKEERVVDIGAEEQQKALRHFRKMDEDGSGLVTAREFGRWGANTGMPTQGAAKGVQAVGLGRQRGGRHGRAGQVLPQERWKEGQLSWAWEAAERGAS